MYAVPNQEAVTVAKKLVDQLLHQFSPPQSAAIKSGKNSLNLWSFRKSAKFWVCGSAGHPLPLTV